jgi:hypothetical protein
MNGRWEFLQTAQKAGAPLSRITLVQRCCIDTSLLTFLAELAHRQAELSARSSSVAPKSAIALFAVVTLESLTQCVIFDHVIVLLSLFNLQLLY